MVPTIAAAAVIWVTRMANLLYPRNNTPVPLSGFRKQHSEASAAMAPVEETLRFCSNTPAAVLY
jgi:hypothetical protein